MRNLEKEIKETEQSLAQERTLQGEMEKFSNYDGQDRVVPIAEIIEEQKLLRKKEVIIKSKIPTLDETVGGFYPGQLNIISGPTGQGKTTFSKTLTANFSKDGLHSIWFSYEMPPLEFVENFPGTPYFFLPRELTSGSLEWIEKRIAESIRKYQTKIVFIDHLHFLVDMKALAIARNQSILIGVLLRHLKQIALKYDTTIFLLAHLRKTNIEEAIPTIDDLRDSSFVGQEADIVMLIWRLIKKPEDGRRRSKDDPPEWTNESRLSVVKNRRTGALKTFKIQYDFRINEFVEQSSFRQGTELVVENMLS